MFTRIFFIGLIYFNLLQGIDTPVPKTSKINFLVSISKDVIDKIISDEIPSSVTETGNGEGFMDRLTWDYTITRGDVEYSIQDNKVLVKAPLDGILNASIKGLKGDFNLKLSGIGGFESQLGITPTWNIEINSTPVLEINKIELPFSIPFLGKDLKVNLNIENKIYDALKLSMDSSLEKMDAKVRGVKLRQSAEKIWDSLNEPILIDKDKNSWLTVRPLSIRYSDFSSDFESLQMYFMIEAEVETMIGMMPNALNLGPLPNIEKAQPEKQFMINMPIEISYAEMEKLVQNQLKGTSYTLFTGSTTTIKNIVIKGDQAKMDVFIDFTSDIFWGLLKPKGTLVITGNPSIEKTQSKIYFNNLNYTLETDSYILKWINSSFKNSIVKWINQSLQTGISDIILSTQKDINRKLEELNVNEGIVLKGHLETLKIEDVTTEVDRMTVDTYFDGDVSIKIKSLW